MDSHAGVSTLGPQECVSQPVLTPLRITSTARPKPQLTDRCVPQAPRGVFYRNWSWWLSYSGHVCQRELTIFIPKLQTRQIQNSTETNVKRHQESTERRVQSNWKDAHLVFKRNANLITLNCHLFSIRPTRVKVWHHDNLIKVWGNRQRTRFSLIEDNVALPSRVTNVKPLEAALLQWGEKCKVQSHLWSLGYNGKQCSGHGGEISHCTLFWTF